MEHGVNGPLGARALLHVETDNTRVQGHVIIRLHNMAALIAVEVQVRREHVTYKNVHVSIFYYH